MHYGKSKRVGLKGSAANTLMPDSTAHLQESMARQLVPFKKIVHDFSFNLVLASFNPISRPQIFYRLMWICVLLIYLTDLMGPLNTRAKVLHRPKRSLTPLT